MKALLKNLNFGALVVLVSVVTLTVSWKNHESRKPATNWYQVVDNGANPANKQIVGLYPGGSPTTPCTSTDEERPLCAIELDLPSSTTFPITMQDVIDNSYPQGEKVHQEEE